MDDLTFHASRLRGANHTAKQQVLNLQRPMSFDKSLPLVRVHDIIVIGAGPASLAICARLCEPTPSALFTDEEHRRYHWIKPSSPTFKERGETKKRTWLDESTGLPTPPSSVRSSISSVSLGSEAEAERSGQGQDLGSTGYSTLVLDAQPSRSGPRFLERWHTLFSLCSIPHLRSPLFFHLDPADRDSLLSYACNTGRYSECVEIGGVVGKEVSKHVRKQKSKQKERPGKVEQRRHNRTINERDRQDYFTPSTRLFADHCDAIVRRYGLDEGALIRSGTIVTDIDYDYASTFLSEQDCDAAGLLGGIGGDYLFRIQTRCATATDTATTTEPTVFYAKAVICATGPTLFSPPPASSNSTGPAYKPRYDASIAIHSSQMQTFPAPQIIEKMRRSEHTTVAVIGGGLTAAQLTSALLTAGVHRVYLLVRSPRGMQVKPFDVDLSWMSKFKNARKAEFWGADGGDEERAAMIKEARGGGSVPAAWAKRLKAWEAEGRLCTRAGMTVEDVTLAETREDMAGARCHVKTRPQWDAQDGLRVDYVYFATGAAGSRDVYETSAHVPDADMASSKGVGVPTCLQGMQAKYPIPWINGLPSLTDDLSWHSCAPDSPGARLAIPLFVTGALAALRLGPGAANLEGARTGAERIAWAIEDLPFAKSGPGAQPESGQSAVSALERDQKQDYLRGVGGQYAALAGMEA